MSDERDPEPGFETIMREARGGRATMDDVVLALAGTPILVPSSADFRGAPEKFQPLMFTSPQGTPVMAVFTARDRAARFAEMAPYLATMTGRNVLAGLQPGTGLVVNPGSGLGMEIPPPDVGRMLAAMPAAPVAPGPNVLVERAILDARLGVVPHEFVMSVLDGASLYIASSTTVDRLVSDVTPLVLEHGGAPHVAVFTRLEYLEPFAAQASYGLHTPINDFATSLVAGVGIVINPGLDWAYLVFPSDVDALRRPR